LLPALKISAKSKLVAIPDKIEVVLLLIIPLRQESEIIWFILETGVVVISRK